MLQQTDNTNLFFSSDEENGFTNIQHPEKSESLSVIDRMQYKFLESFIKHIKQNRKKMGISQTQLARQAGVARSTIARIESYQYTTLNLTVVLKILNVLDLNIEIVENN